jgi:hypothetical protein
MIDREYLREMAKVLESKLPDNHGFILLAFPFGDDPNQRLIYTSNARREDAINALKEFLIKAGAAEDWMKHIQ